MLARKKQDQRKSASEEARKQAMWDERNRIRDEEEKAAASGVAAGGEWHAHAACGHMVAVSSAAAAGAAGHRGHVGHTEWVVLERGVQGGDAAESEDWRAGAERPRRWPLHEVAHHTRA